MAQSPERSLLNDVWSAHQLAGKAHIDGAKPLTRLGGAVVVGAIGVGGEFLVQKARPVAFKKLDVENVELHPLLDELLNDGLVAVVYTVANKNLGEALPKLKLRHLTTSTLGTLAVAGVEGVRGKVGNAWSNHREKSKNIRQSATPAAPVVEQPEQNAVSAEQPAVVQAAGDVSTETALIPPAPTTEKKRSILDFVNPVTALAADEARLAVRDMLDAYRAVVAGTEEEFIITHKPKDEKELSIAKETTVIFMGGSGSPEGASVISTAPASS